LDEGLGHKIVVGKSAEIRAYVEYATQ